MTYSVATTDLRSDADLKTDAPSLRRASGQLYAIPTGLRPAVPA